MLVTPHIDLNQWELTYMAVLPEFRGKGLGRQMLAELTHFARKQNIDQIILAVDAANHPAKSIYDEAGFAEWTRRWAYLKAFTECDNQ